MNRKLLLLALGLVPASAAAQTVDTGGARLEIAGQAPFACVVHDPTTVDATNATVETTSGSSSSIHITQMVDTQTAQARGATVDLSLPVICNGPHSLTLSSSNGGMLRAGGTPAARQGGFAEYVPYRISATWGAGRALGESNQGAPLVIDSNTGRAGNVIVSIDVPRGRDPLVAGAYSDEIVIEFHAAS